MQTNDEIKPINWNLNPKKSIVQKEDTIWYDPKRLQVLSVHFRDRKEEQKKSCTSHWWVHDCGFF